jgi:hypothetical protein
VFEGTDEEQCVVEGLQDEFSEEELEELSSADEFPPDQVDAAADIFDDCLPFAEFISATVEDETGDSDVADCVMDTYDGASWGELFGDLAGSQESLAAAIELCSNGSDGGDGGLGAPTPNDPGSDISWFDANAGDCFEVTDADTGSYVVIDCDDAHTAEIFSVFELPAGEFPGVDAVQEAAEQGCNLDIESYSGASAGDLGVEIGSLFPTEDTWNQVDDREIVCYAHGDLAGSIFGSA